MPKVVDVSDGPRFARERRELVAAGRRLVEAEPDAFRDAGAALDATYTEAAARDWADASRARTQARARGTPSAGTSPAPDSSRPQDATLRKMMAIVHADPNGGDSLRAVRLHLALRDLLAINATGEHDRPLSRHLPRAERECNARNGLLIALLLLDPDAGEYLSGITDLAKIQHRGSGDPGRGGLGKLDLLPTWHGDGLALLQECVALLSDTPRRDPISAAAVHSAGRLWFDDDGALHQSGPVPFSHYLEALSDQLNRFLRRLETCDHNAAGDYLPSDGHAGRMRGLEVLWSNVVLLAGGALSKTLPLLSDDARHALKPGEMLVTTLTPPRNAQPLADLLKQLQFAILWQSNTKWADRIPASTIAKLQTLARELDDYRRTSTCEGDRDLPTHRDYSTPASLDPPEGTHRGGTQHSPREDWTLPTAVAWFLEAWEPAARLRPPLTSDPSRVPLAEKPPKLHELWVEVYARYLCLNQWLHERWYRGARPEPADVADCKAVAAQIAKHRLLHTASKAGDGILTADHAAQIEEATNFLRDKARGDGAPPHQQASQNSPEDDTGLTLTANDKRVLLTMALFDAAELVGNERIVDAMPPKERLSAKTVGKCVAKLMRHELAERPDGIRSGARLTIRGRRRAAKVTD